jgi:hypothetical protein
MLFRSRLVLTLSLILAASSLPGEDKDPANYPLRIHIFRRSETTFYHNRVADDTKGDGRANLFENGKPRGMDFEFDCSKKLKTSSGFETFPARWKKPVEELTVLQPEFGKVGNYSSCKLKVQMKNFAYFTRNGTLMTEPIAVFEDWMIKHAYDPEHGKEVPTQTNEPNPAK